MLTEVLLLRAGELNCNEVPVVTVPVLVTESEGFASGVTKAISIGVQKWDRGGRGKCTCDTEVATFDEGAGNGKNLLGKEGYVEGLRDGRGALENVQQGLVARLDGHDGCGGSQNARVLDEVRSTKVRAHTDVFYDPSDCHHSRDIHEHAREVERASRRWFLAECNDDFLMNQDVKRRREERDSGCVHTSMTETWVDSSFSMIVSCSMAMSPDEKPALEKSDDLNLLSPCL